MDQDTRTQDEGARLSTDDLVGRPEPVEQDPAPEARDATAATDVQPLFGEDEGRELKDRWGSIQTSFVDEPRQAVEEADTLVADLMTRLAQSFSEERKGLEGQWDRGDDVSTEDLRVALQRYRTFFDRLLAA